MGTDVITIAVMHGNRVTISDSVHFESEERRKSRALESRSRLDAPTLSDSSIR